MENKTFIKFIEKATAKYGNKFDYSQALYVNYATPIKIICPEHGEFMQTTTNHLRNKCGCPKCGFADYGKNKTYNKDIFITKAVKVHLDKYNYDNVEYVDSETKVKIWCKKHQLFFMQRPSDHWNGKGCPLCGREAVSEKQLSNTNEFITKAIKVHGNLYDYSLVNYIRNDEPITIICLKHGQFLLTPNNHLQGKGCKECAIEYCASLLTKSLEEFVLLANIVHSNKYDYSKSVYTGANNKIEIICKEHGSFWLTANSHLCGCGCPKCNLKSLTKLFDKLKISFPNETIIFETLSYTIISWLGNLRFDIYFPEYNIAVEYNGKQHYIPIEYFGGIIGYNETLQRDELKRNKCIVNNCALFEMKYDYTELDYENLVNNIQSIINKKKVI